MVITIDGPSGVGKSTVARAVARKLGMAYLDTGSTYRAAALAITHSGIDQSNESVVVGELDRHTIDYDEHEGVLLDGDPVADLVRLPEVTSGASIIAAYPLVRQEIVQMQRAWVESRGGNAVVEGRDIGTVVFPDAPVKIYLTASPLVRAIRRSGDTEVRGQSVDKIAVEIEARDMKDSTRTASPLRPAEDATIIDTSELTAQEVVEQVVALAEAAVS